jgi:DNA-directed RNA polymerase beta' subunit
MNYIKKLENLSIWKDLTPIQKDKIIKFFRDKCIVNHINHIGIITSQSLLQPLTQSMLSSFKKTGTEEYINISHISDINNLIFLNKNIIYLKTFTEENFSTLTIGDLINSRSFSDPNYYLTITLNLEKIYKFKLHLKYIVNIIQQYLNEKYTINIKSIYYSTLTVDINTHQRNKKNLLNSLIGLDPHSEDNYSSKIKLLDEISRIKLGGLDIGSIVPTYEPYSYTVDVVDKCLYSALIYEGVDYTETISTDVEDVLEVFGIETARNIIIKNIHEKASLSNTFNHIFTNILADYLCVTGSISRVNLNSMYSRDFGLLRKLSFENSIKALKSINGGIEDPLTEPSSKIICGKPLGDNTNVLEIPEFIDEYSYYSDLSSPSDEEYF